jgi:hypothetical protein
MGLHITRLGEAFLRAAQIIAVEAHDRSSEHRLLVLTGTRNRFG